MLKLHMIFLSMPILWLGQSGNLISIEKLMTPQELTATGVAGLTASQRRCPRPMAHQLTATVLQLAQQSRNQTSGGGRAGGGAYTNTGSGHWIKSKSGNGAYITLEDGSVWEVESIDRIDTALWLPISDITVLLAPSPVGDYRYQLINTEDGEKALAKYLGKE